MKLQIKYQPISHLIPYARNAKKHSDTQVSQLAGSIKEFGFVNPVIVDADGSIVAGHGRVLAAAKLGLMDVPTLSVDHLTPQQVKAFRLADNRIAQNSEWDTELLGLELVELKDYGVDIETLGFDIGELPGLDDDGGTGGDPDAVPDEPTEIWVKPGDLFQLGSHRLLCGDSTKREDVERLMNGEKAEMVFTDPPYGISLQADYGNHVQGSDKAKQAGFLRKNNVYRNIIGDDKNFDPSFLLEYFQGTKIFLWGANNYTTQLPIGQWLVWYKKINDGMKKMFGWEFELCWTNQSAGQVYEHAWAGVCGHDKVLDGTTKTHPTMKSVGLILKIFTDYFADSVVDLYLGSGSTLIACEKTQRICYGMEIDPAYCQIILQRWATFSGKQWTKEEQ